MCFFPSNVDFPAKTPQKRDLALVIPLAAIRHAPASVSFGDGGAADLNDAAIDGYGNPGKRLAD